jgi:predicted nucleic acid-binding protein
VIVFFDASALIYLIEGREPFGSRVRAALAALLQMHPAAGTAVSRLSWLECRVGPMKAHDTAVLAAYDAFFARPDLLWVDLTRDVVELAAAVRVRHGLRTADALQAASCLQLGPEHRLLTGDPALRCVYGVQTLLLK